MLLKTPSAAIDAIGTASYVGRWLNVPTSEVSGWRTRGVSRSFACHFYAALVVERGYELAPQVFGLDSWRSVVPGLRNSPKTRKAA